MSRVKIPIDRLEIRSARSGGPGGQHVNKTESKIEIRFSLDEADWIPPPVRFRIRQSCANRINMAGELIISSEKHRSQKQNLMEAILKLETIIDDNWNAPKARVKTRATRGSKERRLQGKKKHGEKKKSRKVDY